MSKEVEKIQITKVEKDFLNRLRTQDLDMNGRKIINVGAAINDNDVMSKQAVMNLLRELGLID